MYLAYVDDSGNTGLPGSRTYTLGCLFLDVDQWPDAFDAMIDFRRTLRDSHGLPFERRSRPITCYAGRARSGA